MSSIKLNDLLQLDNFKNVKVRFNLMFANNWNPIEIFKNNERQTLLEGQYWNYNKNKSFKEGQITIGFIRIKSNENSWLLFHIGKVTKDLNILNGVGYEYETLSEYEKYFGRLIIKFKNTSQNMIRNAESVIEDCEVVQILPDIFNNDIFPGYDKVNITWNELLRVLEKDTWKTALQNQKGVYLITDTSNGKMYVGSAYGDEMILNRWKSYVKSGHGNNKELQVLDFNHIKEYFRYSILDIYKSTTDTQTIIERENWWKEVLLSRKFGYNSN
ncbi:MAG: GIY-YIG nuclease family protein [Chitinophagales bacterium]|nr:GIY-YIG nuclease family protein [Chitinophagales bacterium]